MDKAPSSAIILFAHGARDPEWAIPFRTLQKLIAAKLPDIPVELAFLELMQPSLDAALDKLAATGVQTVSVFPIFMAQGGHLKRDLPALLDQVRIRHPGIALRAAPPIGEVEAILQLIADWVCREHPL